MVGAAAELAEHVFDRLEVGEGALGLGRTGLVFEIAEFDQEIDLPLIHQLNALGHLGRGFSIVTPSPVIHIGVVWVGHNPKPQRRLAIRLSRTNERRGHGKPRDDKT